MRSSLLLLAAVAAAAFAAAPAGARSSVAVTIRHQIAGCHSWSVAGNAFTADQRVKLARGTAVTFTNDDVMPHTLVQIAGPRVSLHRQLMNHMGARTSIVLTKPGTYRFRTKAGEDYPSMAGMKTTGEDNVLRLVIVVR